MNGVPPLGKKECLVYVNPYGKDRNLEMLYHYLSREKNVDIPFRNAMIYVGMFDGILMQRAMNLYISFF